MKLDVDFILEPLQYDLSSIIELTEKLSRQEWVNWSLRQNRWLDHKDTKTYPFIWDEDTADYTNSKGLEYFNLDTPLWKCIKPLIDILEVKYNGKASNAMLALLPSKGIIPEHDDGGSLIKVHRLHIPIITNDKVYFFVNGTGYNLTVGNIYELNNVAPHGVYNLSEKDRVHLIIDITPN